MKTVPYECANNKQVTIEFAQHDISGHKQFCGIYVYTTEIPFFY